MDSWCIVNLKKGFNKIYHHGLFKLFTQVYIFFNFSSVSKVVVEMVAGITFKSALRNYSNRALVGDRPWSTYWSSLGFC